MGGCPSFVYFGRVGVFPFVWFAVQLINVYFFKPQLVVLPCIRPLLKGFVTVGNVGR